eukprot:Phypoly_transcript_02569.p1 GENE.Phypoly_transcript_02569~~Phypoly_transcript_02569.p1  ORF type:complete len:769 (+),score=147.95 Phypoly_transcript_02569:385-2691(+)
MYLEKNKLFADMVPAAEAINGAVGGMVVAAEQAIAIVDEEYKGQIGKTTEDLKDAGQQLVNYAYQVRSDPQNRAPQREAIKAAKSVLQNVTSLVLIEEMANIKALAVMAKRIGEATTRITEATTREAAEYPCLEVERVSEELIKRVSQRAADSKNPDFREALQDSCNELHDSITKHHKYTSEFLVDLSTEHADMKNKCAALVFDALDEVIEGVKVLFEEHSKFVDSAFKFRPIRTIAEEEVLKARGDLVTLLGSLVESISKGDGPTRARAIVAAAQREMDNAISVAENTKDPIKKEIITKGVAALKKETAQLVTAIKPVLANPNNEAAAKILEAEIRATQQIAESLASAVAHSPAEAVAINGNKLAYELETLVNAAKKGDRNLANAVLATLGGAFDRHIEMAEIMAQSIQDRSRREEVLDAINKLKNIKSPILTAAKAAIETDSAEAHQKLAQLVAEAKSALYTISRPHEMVSAVGNQLQYNIDTLLKVMERGGENVAFDTQSLAKNIATDAKRQAEAAEAYAATLKNPKRKQEIKTAANEVGNYADQLIAAIDAFATSPKDKAKKERVEKLAQKTKEASERLTEITKPTAEDTLELRAAKASLNYAGMGEPNLAVIGPVDAHVMLAAQEMAAAVRGKLSDSSPLGKLVSFSKTISEDMANLAAFAAQGKKKEMIMAAKKIAAAVKQVVANAQAICANCQDPVLRSAVSNYANAASNYGTQLSIIAAVKAASDDNDPTAEAQLVTCSQGLCASVIGAVGAAESASIKK